MPFLISVYTRADWRAACDSDGGTENETIDFPKIVRKVLLTGCMLKGFLRFVEACPHSSTMHVQVPGLQVWVVCKSQVFLVGNDALARYIWSL